MPPNKFHSENGNALIFILIGIALFAALAFTVARGFRSESTGNLTTQNTNLLASDLAATAQSMERGVSGLRNSGISESDISFETTGITANSNCLEDACKLFNPGGGRKTYKSLPSELHQLGGADTRWQFTGTNEIPGLGEDGGTDKESDLVALIEGLSVDLCAKINSKTRGSADIPVLNNGFNTATGEPFAGTYGTNVVTQSSGPSIDGKNSFCVKNGSSGLYLFYYVLLAR